MTNGRTSPPLVFSVFLTLGCANERVYGTAAEDAGARGAVGVNDASVAASGEGDATGDESGAQGLTVEVNADASVPRGRRDASIDEGSLPAQGTDGTGRVTTGGVGSEFTAPHLTTTDVQGSASSPDEVTSGRDETDVAASTAGAADTVAPESDTTSSSSDVTTPPDVDPTECDLVNGSFEQALSNPGAGVSLPTGATTLVGWSVVEGSVYYAEDIWEYADGHRSIELNGGAAGGVEQAFPTVPGRGYLVRFALSGNPDRTSPGASASPTVKGVQVWAGDHSQTFTFDVTGHDIINMGWVEHEFTFNATSTTSELRFRSITYSDHWGPVIDDVRLYGCGS